MDVGQVIEAMFNEAFGSQSFCCIMKLSLNVQLLHSWFDMSRGSLSNEFFSNSLWTLILSSFSATNGIGLPKDQICYSICENPFLSSIFEIVNVWG